MCLAHTVGVFGETGSVTHKKGAGRTTIRIEKLTIYVRNRMEQEPTNPLRRLAQKIGVFYEHPEKNLNMHPYKMQPYQVLLPTD
ncbi:hypothetical protein Trydic_g21490 [Trypoxylus dichotomus]